MTAQIDIKHQIGDLEFTYHCTIKNGITGIYGPSGAGKSTFLNLIAGLEKPLSGKILLKNQLVYDSENNTCIPETKRDIGYVFQDGRLFPHLSVKQNLLYSEPYNKNKKRYITFDDIVDLLDLSSLLNKKPRQLSGGERQRVAIGRALLNQPALLLLDEPFSNLDRHLRRQIISYLIRINKQFQLPMLIVSHIIGDILRLTDQVLVISKRSIVAQGDVFDLMTNNAVPDLIRPRRYLNIFDAKLEQFNETEKLFEFSHIATDKVRFTTSSKILPPINKGSLVRFAIRPDDISLSKTRIHEISIQNQLRGRIQSIIETENSIYCVVNVGVDLVVEITEASLHNLQLKKASEVYCLIKANSIEVIHSER